MLIGRAKASLFSANGRFEHWEAADSIRGLGEVLTGGRIFGGLMTPGKFRAAANGQAGKAMFW